MLGRRSAQRSFFEADQQYLEMVGKDSFYAYLAGLRGTLFRDEEFAALYDDKTGRPSVPPSLLATALLLQTYDRVSEEEAMERAAFDLRWKVALGIPVEKRPFVKSTLQLFRAQLLVHDEAQRIFVRSLELAREQGYVRKRKLRLALDTTAILGRGAVKDTYNLLGDGIVLVLRQLANLAELSTEEWAEDNGYERYVSGSSLKGSAELDWDDAEARTGFLCEVVADADRLLEAVREARGRLPEGSPEEAALVAAAERLSQVLLQDIERREQGAVLRDGVAKDRMPSVHDPEMRHGRKSSRQRFDGHKAQIAVDVESQLITAVEVVAGNAPDAEEALELVEEAERNGATEVEETIADCAFGSGTTRQAFAKADRRLVAKVPASHNQGRFPKTAFRIDLEAQACTCPAGKTATPRYRRDGQLRRFQFEAAVCEACPLRSDCVRGRGGRSIAVHPQEALLQEARALQESPDFARYRRDRQVAEHRLARLVQLGIRQARYFGRTKTRFQLLMAATVANLTLLAAFAQQNTASTLLSAALLALLVASWALTRPHLRPEAALPRRSVHPTSQPRCHSLHPFPLLSTGPHW
jgi:hypothetical protein